jgi:hypothetical protein
MLTDEEAARDGPRGGHEADEHERNRGADDERSTLAVGDAHHHR